MSALICLLYNAFPHRLLPSLSTLSTMLASKQSVFAGRTVAARATMARARAGARWCDPCRWPLQSGQYRAPERVSLSRSVRVNAREAAWCPGSDAPAHLDGSLPGYDPAWLTVLARSRPAPASHAGVRYRPLRSRGRFPRACVPGVRHAYLGIAGAEERSGGRCLDYFVG